MSDEPFYSPTKQPPGARVPQPGEPLWRMVKNGHTCQAELREQPGGRCELQLFADGEFRWSHLHASREWAIAEALIKRETLRVKGWGIEPMGTE